MIVIDEKFLVIKEINGYLVDMILINSIRSGPDRKFDDYEISCFGSVNGSRRLSVTEETSVFLGLSRVCC
jgi:hypothetical protein